MENIISNKKIDNNPKPTEKTKSNKKLLIITVILIFFLGGGFFIYYKYYAKGIIEIIPNTSNIDIKIGFEEYKNISNPIKIKLPEGEYNIVSSKEDYLENQYSVNVKKMRKIKKYVDITNIKKIADLNFEEIQLSGNIYPTLSHDGLNFLYYDSRKIKKLDLSTKQIQTVTNLDFIKDGVVMSLKWSPDKNKLLIKFLNEENKEAVWQYNLTTKQAVKLNDNIQEACWLPEGEKIAYIYKTDTSSILAYADYNGKNWIKIKDINPNSKFINCSPTENQIILTYPDMNNIILSQINFSGSEQKYIINNNLVFPNNLMWSFLGKKVLIAVDNKTIKILNTQTGQIEEKVFNIFNNWVTWVEENNLLFFENNSNNNFSNEFIISKLDLSGNIKTTIDKINSGYNFDPKYFVFEKDKKTLYFISNGYLLKLDL